MDDTDRQPEAAADEPTPGDSAARPPLTPKRKRAKQMKLIDAPENKQIDAPENKGM